MENNRVIIYMGLLEILQAKINTQKVFDSADFKMFSN